MNAAIIATTIANTNRDPKQQKEPYQVDNFMIDYEKIVRDELEIDSGEEEEVETYKTVDGIIKKKQDPMAMLETIKMLNAAMRGKVTEKKDEDIPDSELFPEGPSESPLEV